MWVTLLLRTTLPRGGGTGRTADAGGTSQPAAGVCFSRVSSGRVFVRHCDREVPVRNPPGVPATLRDDGKPRWNARDFDVPEAPSGVAPDSSCRLGMHLDGDCAVTAGFRPEVRAYPVDLVRPRPDSQHPAAKM